MSGIKAQIGFICELGEVIWKSSWLKSDLKETHASFLSCPSAHYMLYTILSKPTGMRFSVIEKLHSQIGKLNSNQVCWAGDGPNACLLVHAIPFVSLQTSDTGTILTRAFTDKTSVIQRSKALNITEQASSERSRIQIQQRLLPSLPRRPFKFPYATVYFFQASWPWPRQAFLDTSHSGRPGAGSVTTMSWHLCLPPQPCEL